MDMSQMLPPLECLLPNAKQHYDVQCVTPNPASVPTTETCDAQTSSDEKLFFPNDNTLLIDADSPVLIETADDILERSVKLADGVQEALRLEAEQDGSSDSKILEDLGSYAFSVILVISHKMIFNI